MSQFQLFPPTDHPHYRLLRELADELDRDSKELAVQGKAVIDDWCARNQLDLDSLLSTAETHVASLLVDLVIMPSIKGTHPAAEDALPEAMGNFCLAFALGYAFALNRPDLP